MKIYVCFKPKIEHNGVDVLSCNNRTRCENSNNNYYSCTQPKPLCPFYRSYNLFEPKLEIPDQNTSLIQSDDIQTTSTL